MAPAISERSMRCGLRLWIWPWECECEWSVEECAERVGTDHDFPYPEFLAVGADSHGGFGVEDVGVEGVEEES